MALHSDNCFELHRCDVYKTHMNFVFSMTPNICSTILPHCFAMTLIQAQSVFKEKKKTCKSWHYVAWGRDFETMFLLPVTIFRRWSGWCGKDSGTEGSWTAGSRPSLFQIMVLRCCLRVSSQVRSTASQR